MRPCSSGWNGCRGVYTDTATFAKGGAARSSGVCLWACRALPTLIQQVMTEGEQKDDSVERLQARRSLLAPLQFSGALRRIEKWLAKNQHTTPTNLRLLRHIRLHVRYCPRSLVAAFWALVTTWLLVPCQLFPSHGNWMLTQDAAGYDRFSFSQHYGRPQWVKSIPTPQMTRFRDAKVCNNLVTDEIDDHRIQSDYKCTIGLQNPEGKNSTLGIASAW